MKRSSRYNLPSSFRDPSGFVFSHRGEIYRQVNKIYKKNYDHLMNSGLYDKLTEEGLLISHKDVSNNDQLASDAYRIIKPKKVNFISYPYEWCFSQLKDAALLTLKMQKYSMDYGMSLKDASSYNVQFKKGRPIFIDTLSFEKINVDKPWIAYRQFCQHFLTPLSLMALVDIRLNQLLKTYLDGIPLDLASKLLPKRSYLSFYLLIHIHLHAKSQKVLGKKQVRKATINMKSLRVLIENLENAVKRFKYNPDQSCWVNYYDTSNYSDVAISHKSKLISEYLDKTKPRTLWDLGSNTGLFSQLAADKDIETTAFDSDPSLIEKIYLKENKKRVRGVSKILPLVLDIANPSPSIGWANKERLSLLDRGPADCVFVLALLHHLVITNNIPLDKLAKFFKGICGKHLIVEFVSRNDSQVEKMLLGREGVFRDYRRSNFERIFMEHFNIVSKKKIKDSKRTLYLMEKH
jgi:ribosomal protein L11 methylase PrmA